MVQRNRGDLDRWRSIVMAEMQQPVDQPLKWNESDDPGTLGRRVHPVESIPGCGWHDGDGEPGGTPQIASYQQIDAGCGEQPDPGLASQPRQRAHQPKLSPCASSKI